MRGKNENEQKETDYWALMLETITEIGLNDVLAANHAKEIEKIKQERIQKEREIIIYAVNYFTPEIIHKLHEQTKKLLRYDDFNEEKYLDIAADSSTMTYQDACFLVNRQKEINSMEGRIVKATGLKKNSIMKTLADLLLEGCENDD